MPLWLSTPAVVVFGVSSWISTLDPTGGHGDSYLLWGATVIAASLLVLRLLRSA
jgi:drug/metabolite transporter superfamily protein YnfA